MLENTNQMVMMLSLALAVLGIVCLIISIVILAKQAVNRNIQAIAESTTKLAEKGITYGISGLVGNASLLISSLNDMTKSNTGIGIFFVFLSLVLLAAAYYLIQPFLSLLP